LVELGNGFAAPVPARGVFGSALVAVVLPREVLAPFGRVDSVFVQLDKLEVVLLGLLFTFADVHEQGDDAVRDRCRHQDGGQVEQPASPAGPSRSDGIGHEFFLSSLRAVADGRVAMDTVRCLVPGLIVSEYFAYQVTVTCNAVSVKDPQTD